MENKKTNCCKCDNCKCDPTSECCLKQTCCPKEQIKKTNCCKCDNCKCDPTSECCLKQTCCPKDDDNKGGNGNNETKKSCCA